MGGADFCKFSHAFRHGLLLSERILQISPGKNDNLPLMATTSTVWGSGSIGLSLVAQSRPPQISLLCGFCPLAREFALRRTFQPPQSDFLQIPPRDGHPCLWLTVPATESVVDFHHQVVDHAGRTQKRKTGLPVFLPVFLGRTPVRLRASFRPFVLVFKTVCILTRFRGRSSGSSRPPAS